MAAGRARRCRPRSWSLPLASWWVPLALLALVAGCTAGVEPAPAPSPTPVPVAPQPTPEDVRGLRVGVVLPPLGGVAEAVLDRMRGDLDRLERRLPAGVAELRTVVPDDGTYVADTVAVLADDGYGLVCVVGPTAAAAVASLAREFPRTRFCVLPARLRDPPANVLSIDIRIEEFAFLAGAAAARPSGATPVFVVGPARYATERQRVAFRAGIEQVRGAVTDETTTVVVTDAEQAYDAATEAYADGTFVVLTDAGAADQAVLRAAQEQGALVIGSEATLLETPDDETGITPPISPSVLLLVRERLDVPILLAIDQALGEWPEDPASVGFAEGALQLVGGGSAIWPVIEPQVTSLRDALVAGDLVVPPPS